MASSWAKKSFGNSQLRWRAHISPPARRCRTDGLRRKGRTQSAKSIRRAHLQSQEWISVFRGGRRMSSGRGCLCGGRTCMNDDPAWPYSFSGKRADPARTSHIHRVTKGGHCRRVKCECEARSAPRGPDSGVTGGEEGGELLTGIGNPRQGNAAERCVSARSRSAPMPAPH